MVKRANRKSRKASSRNERIIVLLAVEGGNKTEKTYFTELNRIQTEYRVVFADGNNTDSVNVVKDAIAGVSKNGLDLKDGDMAYAVIDTDFGKGEQIKEAKLLAHRKNIKLILSNPCFEVWLLQHFRYSTKGYTSNEAVIAELTNRWPSYRKEINSFKYLLDRLDVAVENSKRLMDFHNSVNPNTDIEDRNPSTNVHELVEIIKPKGGDSEDKK